MSEFEVELSVNEFEPVSDGEPESNFNQEDFAHVRFTVTNCESMIKWSLLELATNPTIDHRGYCRDRTGESLLANTIKSCSNSFDAGIQMLSKSICSNAEVIRITMELEYFHNLPDDSDEVCDNIYPLESELFELFVELSGLYEINSLHPDSSDEFKDHLFDLVYSR